MANSRTENLENKYDPIEANTSDFVLSFNSGLPSLAFLYFWLLLHSNCFGELFLVPLFGQLRKNKVVKWGSQTNPDTWEINLLVKCNKVYAFSFRFGAVTGKTLTYTCPRAQKEPEQTGKNGKAEPCTFSSLLGALHLFPSSNQTDENQGTMMDGGTSAIRKEQNSQRCFSSFYSWPRFLNEPLLSMLSQVF